MIISYRFQRLSSYGPTRWAKEVDSFWLISKFFTEIRQFRISLGWFLDQVTNFIDCFKRFFQTIVLDGKVQGMPVAVSE